MGLKESILAHRARKKMIVGSNKIAMLACAFYIMLKLVYVADMTNLHWDLDITIAGIILILLMAWELFISFIR